MSRSSVGTSGRIVLVALGLAGIVGGYLGYSVSMAVFRNPVRFLNAVLEGWMSLFGCSWNVPPCWFVGIAGALVGIVLLFGSIVLLLAVYLLLTVGITLTAYGASVPGGSLLPGIGFSRNQLRVFTGGAIVAVVGPFLFVADLFLGFTSSIPLVGSGAESFLFASPVVGWSLMLLAVVARGTVKAVEYAGN